MQHMQKYAEYTKSNLDNLLKQGLTSHDSTGKKYKVVSFDFTYVERNLYEDEVGNLMVTPEYLTEHCNGDTLRSIISASIYDRTKAGDTVFIDNVMVVRFQGKSNVPMPDHVLPIARGGSGDVSNIQPLCFGKGGCNNRKSIKHIDFRNTNLKVMPSASEQEQPCFI